MPAMRKATLLFLALLLLAARAADAQVTLVLNLETYTTDTGSADPAQVYDSGIGLRFAHAHGRTAFEH
jgi:hypothetical protein